MITYSSCLSLSILLLASSVAPNPASAILDKSLQSCLVYPLQEIVPNKFVHFATTFKGNYFQALNYCRRYCMQLVSINSLEEQKAIENHIKNSPYKSEDFWTSGNDLADEGVFSWSSTGDRFTYTNWLKGEPNNVVRKGVGENCVHLWSTKNYQWNDLQCDTKYYFICEVRM